MKKIIALLLALMMTFSVATVAFATEESAPAEDASSVEEMLGEYSWILDLPFSTVKPALKIAKIALKLVLVYVKICRAFNLDPMETAQAIMEFVDGLNVGEEAPEGTEETAPAAVLA